MPTRIRDPELRAAQTRAAFRAMVARLSKLSVERQSVVAAVGNPVAARANPSAAKQRRLSYGGLAVGQLSRASRTHRWKAATPASCLGLSQPVS